MKPGVIKVADRDGVFVIKMQGDVRLTLSLTFDKFIDDMFLSDNFCSVIFDLSEAQETFKELIQSLEAAN